MVHALRDVYAAGWIEEETLSFSPPELGAVPGLRVRGRGAIAGTVGGGLLEATVLETAPDVFAAGGALLHAFDLTKNDVAGMDMICGGRLSVLVVFRALQCQGFTDEDLARVHCPIGVDIAAETPEEIAVSIVGELILIRAGRRR